MTPTLPPLDVCFLGLIPYREACALQRDLVAEIRAGVRSSTLLLLEHDPVITLGSAASQDHVLAPLEELQRRGIDVEATDRGGAATYHGPGQLVGYPLVDLALTGKDLGRYLRSIERALIQTLSHFRVRAWSDEGRTGVWCDQGKIAAIGIRVSRWIAYHGFALNVSPDLDHFRCLVPCAEPGAEVASLATPGVAVPTVREVGGVVAREVASALGFGETASENWIQRAEFGQLDPEELVRTGKS